MITFIIGSYQVFAQTGSNQPVRIYMYDGANKYCGYIDFIRDYAGTKNFVLHDNGIVNAFMPLDKLHPILDILRNEKPVSFVINETYNWAALRTGLEATGEEETD